jgi:hypothetical protein
LCSMRYLPWLVTGCSSAVSWFFLFNDRLRSKTAKLRADAYHTVCAQEYNA